MVTIREEKFSDAVAREALLDEAYGADRFTKTSERLREGRLPAVGFGTLQPGRSGPRFCSGRWPFTRLVAIAASARP